MSYAAHYAQARIRAGGCKIVQAARRAITYIQRHIYARGAYDFRRFFFDFHFAGFFCFLPYIRRLIISRLSFAPYFISLATLIIFYLLRCFAAVLML